MAQHYAPPLFHVLRLLGIKACPPHYYSFHRIVVGQGIWFGVIWGAMMWFADWRGDGLDASTAVVSAGFVGVSFGVGIAAFSAWFRRKWKLANWSEL